MKKIIYRCIILSSLFFTNIFTINTHADYVVDFLKLQRSPEVYELQHIPSLKKQDFSNTSLQKKYNNFLTIDTILRYEFLRQYTSGQINAYQMQDLINNYRDFIYYTNKTFEYLSFEEKGYRGKETQNAIYKGYSNMRTSYERVKNIIK